MSAEIGIMLAGQAGQEVGMGYDAYHSCDESKRVYEIANEATEENLTDFSWNSKPEELKGPLVQPALAASQLADLAWMRQKGLNEAMAMGHSVSEVTALGAEQAFDLPEMFKILKVRGLAMEDAHNKKPGIMKAFMRLSEEEVEWLTEFANRHFRKIKGGGQKIKESGAWIGMANWREQNVVSGDQVVIEFMEAAAKRLNELGRMGKAVVMMVKDDGAAHTKHMELARQRLWEEIQRAKKYPPAKPVLMNDGRFMHDPANYADYLSGQLVKKANWRLAMWVAALEGYRCFVEPGSKKLMTSFMQKEFPGYEMITEKFGEMVIIKEVLETPIAISKKIELLAV